MEIGKPATGIPLQATTQSDPASIAEAARQLEGQFAKMLIASMRTTSLGDSMFPGASEHYRDMYDDQLAKALTRGRGLGLQEMIRRELGDTSSPRSAFEAARMKIEQASEMFPLHGYRRQAAAMKPLAPATGQAPSPVAPPLRAASTAAPATAPAGAASAAILGARMQRSIAAEAAPTGCDGTPASNPAPNTPEAFVARLWPHAQRAAAELGVCPRALVAQAALETGWGRHQIRRDGGAESANNLFGIKATGRWSGEAVTRRTTEYVDGAPVQENAAFRAYRSIADSFSDYVNLLKNSPRYAAALGQSSARAFAGALQRAGYATDPQYAAKLAAIADGPTMRRALAQIDGSSA